MGEGSGRGGSSAVPQFALQGASPAAASAPYFAGAAEHSQRAALLQAHWKGSRSPSPTCPEQVAVRPVARVVEERRHVTERRGIAVQQQHLQPRRRPRGAR